MSLAFFRGLNCYSASLINVAALAGGDYRDAFADLWSETDFTYDQVYNLFLSQRLPTNLEALGIRTDFVNCCSQEEKAQKISSLPAGQWLIVGIDAFYIPWVPFYQTMHDLHYFIARKEPAGVFSCYDPTYDKQNLEITEVQIILHAEDACIIQKIPPRSFKNGILSEAQKILSAHPQLRENLIAQITECALEPPNGELLARYVDALIKNRYLYLHYLQNTPLLTRNFDRYFDQAFFRKWTAVKHGLYKASISKENQSLIEEVCGLLRELLEEEQSIARKIASTCIV